MPVLAIQCPSGISGDMLLAALIDAGASLDRVRAAVDAVSPEPIEIELETVRRAGFAARKVHIDTERSHHHRGWQQIQALIRDAGSALSERTKSRALACFGALARAEAAVHGVAVADVHFHEVGALDAIADIVGVSAALDDLGIVAVHAQTVAVGGGMVETSHGLLPVPVPAVVELFAGTGAVLVPGPLQRELCTPTGAALLVANVRSWGPPPPARVLGSGAGAGAADHPHVPNVVRIAIVEPHASEPDDVASVSSVEVVANVDDLDPRIWPHVLEALLDAGADDAWLTPILMKKGRPAHQVSALCQPGTVELIRNTMLRETSTLGVRVMPCDKQAVARTERVVDVDGHPVRLKEAWSQGQLINQQPEHQDLVTIARATGQPLRQILEAARRAAHASTKQM